MHGSSYWSFLSSHLPANRWTPISRLFAATGGKHTSAGVTSCSCATSAAAKRVSCMRGTGTPAPGFLIAGSALASPISPQWATGGTARRVELRSYALASIGAHAAPSRSNREVCISGLTSISWGCLPITRPCESRGRVMLESTNHASIVSIYGGNAEKDSPASVVGQFVDGSEALRE